MSLIERIEARVKAIEQWRHDTELMATERKRCETELETTVTAKKAKQRQNVADFAVRLAISGGILSLVTGLIAIWRFFTGVPPNG